MAKKIIIFITFFAFISCANPLYRNTFVVAGTYLEVISPYRKAAGIVFREFERLDKIFNHYDPASELAKLNKTFNKEVKVSEDLLKVLELSQEVYNLSNGAFDVSCGVLYNFWKGLINQDKITEFPDDKKLERLKESCGMENVTVNVSRSMVTIKKQGLQVDLGAIAKGYMVDKAIEKLKQNGIDSALINAGGDIYCLGKNKDKPWSAGIKDPEELNEVLESQDLVDEAIATSGNYEQFFEFKGRIYSHLVDPRRGYPVENNILSVSIVSSNCVTADSLATAFFIMGTDKVREFLVKNPSTMKIFIVTLDEGKKNIHIFE